MKIQKEIIFDNPKVCDNCPLCVIDDCDHEGTPVKCYLGYWNQEEKLDNYEKCLEENIQRPEICIKENGL